MRQQTNTLPKTIPGRLELVGRALYGKSFKAKLANALSVSRSTLFEWSRGNCKRRTIDAELIQLLDAARDEADERNIAIAALRKRFLNGGAQ